MARTLIRGDQLAGQQKQLEPASGGALRDYGRWKLELAGIIRSLRQMAEDRNDKDGSNECRNLLSRLAEDRFNLVVVGQFSRGKTSLMNAMLGVDRLPTGVLPLTSVITAVSYGDRERVVIHWQWWSYTSEIPLGELAQYVTQEGNPGNRRRVRCAEVQLPVELLRLGFHFIDTPGVGSAIAANTATTSAFLPEADAVIFLTSFESPLAEAELRLLDQARLHVRKIFVVVNKSDLLPAEQQDAVLAFVETRLKDVFGESPPPAYRVSARDALRARQSVDAEKLRHSGLPTLEADLVEFLQKEKTREFLRRIAGRSSAILSRLRVQFEASRTLGADSGKTKAFDAELNRRLRAARQEREKIGRDLRGRLGSDLQRRFEAEFEQPAIEFEAALGRQVRERLNAHNLFADSLESQLSADAHSAAKRISETWFSEHKQEFQQFVEEAGRNAFEPIRDVIIRIHSLGADCSGFSWQDASVEERLSEIFRENSVAFRAIMPAAWKFEIPWWLELLAVVPPLKAFVARRFLGNAKKLGTACREELRSLLNKSADDWVERLDRQIAGFIDDSARVQRQIIDKEIRPEEVSNLERLRERLEAVVSVLDRMESGTGGPSPSGAVDPNGAPEPDAAARCELCRAVEKELFEFMRHRQYALSANEKDQLSHAERGGFCGIHTWQYEAISSPQGICAAYPPVLTALGRRLRSLADSASASGAVIDGLLELMPGSRSCRACRRIAAVEKLAAKRIVAALAGSRTNGSAPLPALCLRHLYPVLREKPDLEIARRLIVEQSRALDRLGEDMQRYAIKHDALRRELATELEHRVHEVALARIVGLRTIAAPWKVGEI